MEIAWARVERIEQALEAARESSVINLAKVLKAGPGKKNFRQTRLDNARTKAEQLQADLEEVLARHAAAVKERKAAGRRGPQEKTAYGSSPYLSPETWLAILNEAQRAAGLKTEEWIDPKNLRHTHAVWLLPERKWSGMRVAQRLGHRKDVLLKHYFVVRIGPNKAVVEDLDIDLGDGFAPAA